jgi:hypothetical protein
MIVVYLMKKQHSIFIVLVIVACVTSISNRWSFTGSVMATGDTSSIDFAPFVLDSTLRYDVTMIDDNFSMMLFGMNASEVQSFSFTVKSVNSSSEAETWTSMHHFSVDASVNDGDQLPVNSALESFARFLVMPPLNTERGTNFAGLISSGADESGNNVIMSKGRNYWKGFSLTTVTLVFNGSGDWPSVRTLHVARTGVALSITVTISSVKVLEASLSIPERALTTVPVSAGVTATSDVLLFLGMKVSIRSSVDCNVTLTEAWAGMGYRVIQGYKISTNNRSWSEPGNYPTFEMNVTVYLDDEIMTDGAVLMFIDDRVGNDEEIIDHDVDEVTRMASFSLDYTGTIIVTEAEGYFKKSGYVTVIIVFLVFGMSALVLLFFLSAMYYRRRTILSKEKLDSNFMTRSLGLKKKG